MFVTDNDEFVPSRLNLVKYCPPLPMLVSDLVIRRSVFDVDPEESLYVLLIFTPLKVPLVSVFDPKRDIPHP